MAIPYLHVIEISPYMEGRYSIENEYFLDIYSKGGWELKFF
jgi:hypothetical protein